MAAAGAGEGVAAGGGAISTSEMTVSETSGTGAGAGAGAARLERMRQDFPVRCSRKREQLGADGADWSLVSSEARTLAFKKKEAPSPNYF